MTDPLIKANNDKNHVDERRYATRLKVTAGGILILGFWAVIQTALIALSNGTLSPENLSDDVKIAKFVNAIVVTLFIIILSVIILSLRFIIIKGAVREADKGIARNGYLVVAVYLMLIGLWSLLFFVRALFGDGDIKFSDFVILVLDLTSFALLLELFIAAKKLRKVRAEIANADEAENAVSEKTKTA